MGHEYVLEYFYVKTENAPQERGIIIRTYAAWFNADTKQRRVPYT